MGSWDDLVLIMKNTWAKRLIRKKRELNTMKVENLLIFSFTLFVSTLVASIERDKSDNYHDSWIKEHLIYF